MGAGVCEALVPAKNAQVKIGKSKADSRSSSERWKKRSQSCATRFVRRRRQTLRFSPRHPRTIIRACMTIEAIVGSHGLGRSVNVPIRTRKRPINAKFSVLDQTSSPLLRIFRLIVPSFLCSADCVRFVCVRSVCVSCTGEQQQQQQHHHRQVIKCTSKTPSKRALDAKRWSAEGPSPTSCQAD